MIMTSRRPFAVLALALALACHGDAFAQDGVKPKPPAAVGPDKAVEGEIARYCGNLAPSAAEARIAYQTKRLLELEAQVKQRISDLEKRESDAHEWVTKRETLMKSASDDVVAIYAKMAADAAATQIAAMEYPVAVAILIKLAPKTASGILGEMEPEKAATLTSLMAAAADPEKKS
jgi:flagellar motility protein MotE (MotC chaperone)